MLKKFNNYLDKILTEDSVTSGSNPGENQVYKKFVWKNNVYLRNVKDENLRKEIAEKTIDFLINDFKKHIGEDFTWYSPGNSETTGKILNVDEESGFLEFETTNPYAYGYPKTEKRKLNIGMLFTKDARNYFYKLLESPYEENRQAREQRAEEERKKSEEKKATYSSPEMKKVIESFNRDFYSFCDKDYGKVPEELKQRVNELPQEQKDALLNYWDDYEFTDKHLDYYDGPDYYRLKRRVSISNSRAKTLVREFR
jgi:hypothetical protein